MLHLSRIGPTLSLRREGVGVAASDGVHDAAPRILSLPRRLPKEREWWRRRQGLMSLSYRTVASWGVGPSVRLLLIDRSGGGD